MSDIEWRAVTPEEMIQEIEEFVQRSRENKYAYQVGLKDVDFDIDETRLEVLGLSLPFRSIDQAEDAMRKASSSPESSSSTTVQSTKFWLLTIDR